jgi:hypothetical protein
MSINNKDIDKSNAPTPIHFRVSDGQTYGVEFVANDVKEFEIEIKKIALSSIPKHSYIKEIQVKDFSDHWLNVDSLVKRFGSGISLDLKVVDFSYYYNNLIIKAKGSWVLSHHNLLPHSKPSLVK